MILIKIINKSKSKVPEATARAQPLSDLLIRCLTLAAVPVTLIAAGKMKLQRS